MIQGSKGSVVWPSRSEISKITRALVLNRDNFTCQMCGATAGEPHPDDGGRKTRIQVGRIVARFRGGSDDPTNLRAICSVCNDGLRRLTLDRPSSRELLIQIRRATGTDQIEVLRWLVKKFPNGAQGKGGELNRRRSNA
jgi:5-methylcytosine-specific restriction endonuclease McrA